ncbi:MAG TPA: hypothetical protein PL033_13375 [Candidatus Brocadiia bacterium]|nr:hypothetical protein [Candidatus Brocadiia bacterium]
MAGSRTKAVKLIEAKLSLPLGDYSDADYEDVRTHVQEYERIIDAVPGPPAMKIIPREGGMVLSCEAVSPTPYDEFVQKMDISRSITYMEAYIGGEIIQAKKDDGGKPIYQAERSVFSPQPPWTKLVGGKGIDVEKLQKIEYEDGLQRLSWKTRNSPNGSAIWDDGSVWFVRAAEGTRVRVVARQKFHPPPVMNFLTLSIFEDVYWLIQKPLFIDFFSRTLARYVHLLKPGQPLGTLARKFKF